MRDSSYILSFAAMSLPAYKDKQSVMGIPWYTENTWQKMKEISEDKENFHENFQTWLAIVDKSIIGLTNINRPFLRLDIDPVSYSWWCDKNSMKKDKESRRQYVQFLLHNKLKEKS